jgi:uncharacterized protein YcaQ
MKYSFNGKMEKIDQLEKEEDRLIEEMENLVDECYRELEEDGNLESSESDNE